MSKVSAKRSVAEAVADRVRQGKCIHCDEETYARGCCSKHYQQFQYKLSEKPDDEKADFEAAAIREGLILPVGATRKLRGSDNPFADL